VIDIVNIDGNGLLDPNIYTRYKKQLEEERKEGKKTTKRPGTAHPNTLKRPKPYRPMFDKPAKPANSIM